MYIRFSTFKAEREQADFDAKFTKLCESIATSGVSFDEFWQKQALPILLKPESHVSEEQLLSEFDWGSLNPMNALNYFRGQQPQGQPQPQGQNPFMDPAQHKKLTAFQQKADQMVNSIKQRFAVAMKDFLKAVTDDAKSQNDPHMWQIAKSFYQKVMDGAKPIIDKFKMKANVGRGGYVDEFGREAGAMQANKQKDSLDAMKQKMATPEMQEKLAQLRARHAGGRPDLGAVHQGLNSPEVQDMRQRVAGGYDPFRDFGAPPPATFAGNQPAPTPQQDPMADMRRRGYPV